MSKADTRDLLGFLKPFPAESRELALWLRGFVWDLYPECNELIYDNYNALAFGWSPSERVRQTFCSIALGRTNGNVHFGFYWGSRLSDPERRLLGEGNQYRYLLVRTKREFPKTYIRNLMKEAYRYSRAMMKESDASLRGATITKSISPVKRSKGTMKKKK